MTGGSDLQKDDCPNNKTINDINLDAANKFSVLIPITILASEEMARLSTPLLIIEETNNHFARKGDKASCQKNGGINEARARFINCVHIFERGTRCAFLAKNLHVNPHYEISRESLDKFRSQCHDLLLDVVYYPVLYNKVIQTSCGTIVNVNNSALDYSSSPNNLHALATLIKKMKCHETQKKMIQGDYDSSVGTDTNKRNGFQSHFGFAGNHSTEVTKNGVARPILKKNLDDLQRREFVNLTLIGM
jgi:hypothetical protein